MNTLEILDRLIAFPTVSADSNLALVDWVQAYLEARGFACTRLPNADGDKAGLYAVLGAGDGGVLLSGHTDVVPVAGQAWTRDPFRLSRDGARVYGRGVTDMKGYVASMLALADRAAGAGVREPLKLVLSYDEEVGCVGIAEMLDRLAPLLGRPRACFVGEPTEMLVAIGHKGKAALRAVCTGTAGHSALAPRYRNAVHLAADLVVGLRELQEALAQCGARDAAYDVPFSTVHAGKIGGGTALNIVPDRAKVLFEYRHIAEDAPEGIRARIDTLSAQISPHIAIEQLNAYPGLATDPEAEVVALARRLAGTEICKVAFGTEAGFFDGLGIPTVVCGPGSMAQDGHQPDEGIDLAQLDASDRFMDGVLELLR